MPKLSDLQAVVAAWQEIDGGLQQSQNKAQAKGYNRIAARIGKIRTENDRAYFLLIFARFEAFLTAQAEMLVIRRQASPHWNTRRGWDVIDKSRIFFMSRLAYCIEKSSADYNLVKNLYSVRNSLAHEGTTTTPFIIPIVASDLSQVAGRLKS